MSELLTYGSVGGVGRKPGPYPAADAGKPFGFAGKSWVVLSPRHGLAQFGRSAEN